MLIPWYVLTFLAGAAVGSFLNVCIYRIPLEKSILWPGSRCGHCLQPIRWYDNLPLLSYWLLGGRCRRCGARFSVRYFLIELFTGALFALLFYLEVVANVHHFEPLRDQDFFVRWGVIPLAGWAVWAYHAVLLSFLIVATFTDFDHLAIPLPVTVTGTVVGLAGAVLFPWPYPYTAGPLGPPPVGLRAAHAIPQAWQPFPPPGPALGGAGDMPRTGLYPWPVWNVLPPWLPEGSRLLGLATGLAGMLAGALILRTIAFLFRAGRGQEGLGLGDADLMMLVGCFLGWQPVVVAFFVALAPGIVFGLGRLVLRAGREMPFGPSLAVGTMITLLGWEWLGPRLSSFFFDGPLLIAAAAVMVVGMFVMFWMLGAAQGRGVPEPPEPATRGSRGERLVNPADLIAALSNAAAYPEPVTGVEVRQTHISVVFLAGRHAYKVKKPVALGFLDFTSLEKRRHYCEEEVRLNRRLAPSVYLGVVPVARTAAGLRVEAEGEVVEWAVKMERLPAEATLEKRLGRGEVTEGTLAELARRVAAFHAGAEAGPHVAPFGRFDVVADNARENFTQAAAQAGRTVSPAVLGRLRALTEQWLARLRPVIEARAERGVPRDTHGDLHLDHVYLFPDRPPPGDVVIIDCIEFNERFRFADPVADMAFLVMDLAFHGRRDLAGAFARAYFDTAGDREGAALLPFYTAYRAAVRAKVEGIEAGEAEVPEAERSAVGARARAHWLLALGELEEPGRRPCLLLVGGLPGSGKSTLARGLAERAGFRVIRSDVVRKELAGLAPEESGRPHDLYTREWTERTYAECGRRAERLLFEGERVLVDASFGEDAKRHDLLELARRLAVPALLLVCRAGPEVVRGRLADRRGDASDADWSVYQEAAARWEAPGPATAPALREITTDGTPEEALERALQVLRERSLAD